MDDSREGAAVPSTPGQQSTRSESVMRYTFLGLAIVTSAALLGILITQAIRVGADELALSWPAYTTEWVDDQGMQHTVTTRELVSGGPGVAAGLHVERVRLMHDVLEVDHQAPR